jgi:Ni,Fe-hydrogenase III small subunit
MVQPNCPSTGRRPSLPTLPAPMHAMPMPVPMHVPMPAPMPTPVKIFEAIRSTVSAEQQHPHSDSPRETQAHPCNTRIA